MSATKTFHSVNELYEIFGDGKYQVLCIAIICLVMIPVSMQQYIMIFLAISPPWKMRNSTVVIHAKDDGYDDKCDIDDSEWIWVEDKSYSVISQFDLDCDRESLVHLTTMLYFAMSIFGSMFWGYISDRFGRRKALLFGSFCNITCALVNSFAPNLAVFIIFRAANGFFSGCLIMVMVVYGAEIVSKEKRTVGGMFVWFFYTVGSLLLLLISYEVKDWRKILIYCSAPFYIVVLIQWFLPESIAWEFNTNKLEKVRAKIKIISKYNRRKPPDLHNFQINAEDNQQHTDLKNFWLLWKPLKTALQTIIFGTSWIFVGIGYFGMSYAAANLTGNTYRDFALLNGSDIFACFISIYVSSKFGRKKTVITALIFAGVFLLIVASLPKNSEKSGYKVTRLVFGVCGKILATSVDKVMYSWIVETYPTFLRSTASGFHQSCSLVGIMLAPWVALWLDRYHPGLPFYCMGGLLLVAACNLVKIPETVGTNLPENIQQTKQRSRSQTKTLDLNKSLCVLDKTSENSTNREKTLECTKKNTSKL